MVNHWRVKANQLEAARSALTSCVDGAKLTKELNDGLQKDRDRIARRLADAKRVQPNCTLSVRADALGAGAGSADGNGTITGTTHDFRDFAAKCAEYRSERIALSQLLANTCPDSNP